MKKYNIIMVSGLIALLLVIGLISSSSGLNINVIDKGLSGKGKGLFDFFDNAPKVMVGDGLSEEQVKEIVNSGCKIRHKLLDSVSFNCPRGLTSDIKLREARKFKVNDLESNQMIGADSVWNDGITGEGVNVIVLDTGVETNHPELVGDIVDCVNFVDGEDCQDYHGHGTHVAGIITADGVNLVSGEDPTGTSMNAKVIMLKVCSLDGYCYDADMEAALQYAIDNKASLGSDIISISIGGGNYNSYCDSDSTAIKVNNAVLAGYSVVISSGNDGSGVSSPACASKAISVGAVDKSGVIPYWSNRGSILDITAPGVDILSSYSCLAAGNCPGVNYAWMSGTSMAAPHVAGVIALLKQTNPSLSDDEIKNALYSTADLPSGCERCRRILGSGRCFRPSVGSCTVDDYGAGIVNAFEAYELVKPVGPECIVDADCDDGNVCTINTCNVDGNCEVVNAVDKTVCDDSLYCTTGDICIAGNCNATGYVECLDDGVSCTVESCNEVTDSCESTPDDSLCDNNVFCDGVETCDIVSGCLAGTNVNCDDGDSCTEDSCSESLDRCEFNFNSLLPGCSVDESECFKGQADGKCHPKEVGTTCPDCS